jgi:hypothetical protein
MRGRALSRGRESRCSKTVRREQPSEKLWLFYTFVGESGWMALASLDRKVLDAAKPAHAFWGIRIDTGVIQYTSGAD